MFDVILEILPLLAIAVLGYLAKATSILKKEHGGILLRIVFYFALPALILTSVSHAELKIEYALLPLASALIILTIYFISSLTGKKLKLNKKALGVFLVGTMIINNGFIIPFVFASFGEAGLSRLFIFDFSNGLIVFTFVYFLACKYGENNYSKKVLRRKLIFSPPIWAMIIAVIFNLKDVSFGNTTNEFLQILGKLTIPLLMLSLGLFFNRKIVKFKALSLAISIRMFGGLLLGYIFTIIFGFEGLTKTIVLISASAPIGYNTLTFSSLEKLDDEFAASLVSYSILIGIIYTPILIWLFA